MEYSGVIRDGWNKNGTYDRLQYSGNLSSFSDICDFIRDSEKMFENSERSRLDLRLNVNISLEDAKKLQEIFDKYEISTLIGNKSKNVEQLIICKNKSIREVGDKFLSSAIEKTKKRISNSLQNDNINDIANCNFERLKSSGYTFEVENFTSEELYKLWSDSFGWTKDQCDLYSGKLNDDTEKIFGLRDYSGKLVSSVLISNGETTEWSVEKSNQGKGLIIPLLFLSNSWWVRNNVDKVLHVYTRYDRSVSPALKTGFEFNEVNQSGLLTNHVAVGLNENSDFCNIGKPFSDNTDLSKTRTFAIGQLKEDFITKENQDKYLSLIN